MTVKSQTSKCQALPHRPILQPTTSHEQCNSLQGLSCRKVRVIKMAGLEGDGAGTLLDTGTAVRCLAGSGQVYRRGEDISD